jgi:hypothetical protein
MATEEEAKTTLRSLKGRKFDGKWVDVKFYPTNAFHARSYGLQLPHIVITAGGPTTLEHIIRRSPAVPTGGLGLGLGLSVVMPVMPAMPAMSVMPTMAMAPAMPAPQLNVAALGVTLGMGGGGAGASSSSSVYNGHQG